MRFLKNWWIYGPDGSQITSKASTEQNGPDETAQKYRPVIRPVILSESQFPRPPNHTRRASNPPETKKERNEYWFKIFTYAAAIIGVPFVIFQGCGSLRQAKIAQTQLDEMRGENTTNNRPWVLVDRFATEPSANGGIIARVISKNIGKTPAIVTAGYTSLHYFVGDDWITQASNYLSGEDVFPSGSEVHSVLGQDQETFTYTPEISHSDLAELKNGTKKVVMFGAFKYVDVYNGVHKTQFSVEIDPATDKFLILPFRNSIDGIEINRDQ